MSDPRTTTDLSPETVAEAYIEAVGSKDFERLAELLHPEMVFGVGEQQRGRDDYIAVLRRLGTVLVRNDLVKTIVDGSDVCVVYEFVTDTPVGPVGCAEWLTVEDGQIRSIRLIFDSGRWPEVMAEVQRRVAVAT
jgi:hypothetical protein